MRLTVFLVEGFDEMQRVAFVLFDDLAVLIHIDVFARCLQIGAAGQADEGIAPETFAADHGFEQVGGPLCFYAGTHAQRRRDYSR